MIQNFILVKLNKLVFLHSQVNLFSLFKAEKIRFEASSLVRAYDNALSSFSNLGQVEPELLAYLMESDF